MPGFSNQTCNYKLSSFCSGNQKAIVEVQHQRHFYESGDIRDLDKLTTIEELEECR